MEPYTILARLLEQIELNLQSDEKLKMNISSAPISEAHLRRLFRFAFNMPLVSYIRARKLAASIPCLLQSNKRVIDVATMFCFEYEQTYIRAFKQQFGITPGEFRQTQPVLEIVPPMNLLDRNRLGDNLIFGPTVVMVPGFYVVGKLHEMKLDESYYKAPETAVNFWHNEKPLITNIVEPSVYYGLTRLTAPGQNSQNYLVTLIQSVDSVIKCNADNTEIWINASDIYYVESVDKRSFVYTAKSVYRTDLRLYQLIDELTPAGFAQVSKSCILNLNYLQSVRALSNSRMEGLLVNGERVSVTRRYIWRFFILTHKNFKNLLTKNKISHILIIDRPTVN